jgi:phage tail protein X
MSRCAPWRPTTGLAIVAKAACKEAVKSGVGDTRRIFSFEAAGCLARISPTLAAHLANGLAASGFVLPHHITLDMPWSSSSPGDQSTTQSDPPECEISGLVP